MAELILDGSWARAGGAAIKAAGYAGVIRYLSHDKTGKTLTAAEAQDYFNNGLTLRVVYEDGATQALGGEAQGVKDAQFATALAASIGIDPSIGIYYAADFDATPEQQDAINAYVAGIASVHGSRKKGLYGGYWPLSRLPAGSVDAKWQTLAWSGGQTIPDANIYQNGQQAFGAGYDVDEVRKDDGFAFTALGQPSGAAPSIPAAPAPTPGISPAGSSYAVTSRDSDGLAAAMSRIGISNWQLVAQINGLHDPYVIHVGDVLTLPGGHQASSAGTSASYTVTPNDADGLAAAMSRIGISNWQAVAALNGLGSPYVIHAGDVLKLPSGVHEPAAPAPPSSKHYTVTSADSDGLAAAMSRIGISNWQEVASINGLHDPYVIHSGDILQLP